MSTLLPYFLVYLWLLGSIMSMALRVLVNQEMSVEIVVTGLLWPVTFPIAIMMTMFGGS